MARGQHYGKGLSAGLERGALVIRIGSHVLAHAITYSDWANQCETASGDYVREFAITDANELANDVVHAMLHEREDGSTPLSDFLDTMTQDAINDGSLAVECDQHILHGETAACETWAKK